MLTASQIVEALLGEEERDYAKEYRDYHAKPGQVKNRMARNRARYKAEKDGRVSKGDGREVDHKDGDPQNNAPGNLRVVARKTNRAKH